jgi:hypothetical protein
VTKATRTKRNKNKATKSKRTKILWIVIPIVLVGLAVWLVLAYGTSSATPPPSGNSTGPADRVDVVYFHRTQRCSTCIHAEELTRHTLETYFADELDSGKLTFQSLDLQNSNNAAIVNKYGAYGSQLFINTVRDDADHIEQATDLYPLVYKDEAFVKSLKSKIEQSLGGET